jgi:glycosyltransferase involved in cell wall biosynthesis
MDSSGDLVLTVPFYAGAGYLERTLASVLAQRDPAWRCIVVDDSVVDQGIADLVDRLGDDRVSYRLNEANLGVSGSFERCFDIARELGAELVAIVHADDELEPDYVQVAKAAHARHPGSVAVAPRATVIGPTGVPRRTVADTVKAWMWPRRVDVLQGDDGLRRLLRGLFFYCPAVSYRVALLPVPAWDARWKQVMDLDLYGRMLLQGGSIALDPRRTYRYRRHGGTMTELNSSSLLRTEEETAVVVEMTRAARGLGWRRAVRAGRWRLAVRCQALLRVPGLVLRRRFGTAGRAVLLALRP